MDVVPEGSTSHHSIAFYDVNNQVVTPTSLRYKLSSSTGILIAWTTISADASEVVISADSNLIGSAGQDRFLTIEATHNGGEKITSELEYRIGDLQGY